MIFYYGGFPPPYGGVTIKNKLLYGHLSRQCKLRKMDTLKAKKNPFLLLYQTVLLALGRKNRYIVATSKASRRRITMILWRFNRHALGNSLLIVMGGHIAEDIAGDPEYIRALKQYRQLFVETRTLKAKLEKLGFENVSLYPNCRVDQRASAIAPTTGAPLRCLFLSLISPDKGVDLILQAAKATPHIRYDFYGQTEDAYRQTFLDTAASLENVTYHGVFASDGTNIYSKLHEYDVLLLPTKCKTEGVPGVLVEAKIAGVPAVVSDVAYNAELVEHGVAGLVLEENTAGSLISQLTALARDPVRTDKLKQGALNSAKDFLIENYLDDIIKFLR